jgi:hypothetical protein
MKARPPVSVAAPSSGLINDGITDNSQALANLIAATPDGGTIDLPSGIVCLATGLLIKGRTKLRLRGGILKMTGAASHPLGTMDKFAVVFDGCNGCGLEGTTLIGNGKGPLVGFVDCVGSGLWHCDVSGAGGGNAQVASLYGSGSQFIGNAVHDSGGTETRGLWIGNVQTIEIETGALIQNNRVFGNTASGIVHVGIGGVITGNNSNSNMGAGIVVSGNAEAHSVGVTISNNSCSYNAYHGIQAGDSGDVTHQLAKEFCAAAGSVVGNVLFNNINSGVFVTDAVGWTISGNNCFDNVLNGIQVEANVYDISVAGNICLDTRVGSARTQQCGIKAVGYYPDTFKAVSISGNVCSNHKSHGIFAQSNDTALMKSVSITGNSCNGNDGGGIFLAEATVGTITGVQDGNSCRDNAGVDIRNTTSDIRNGTSFFVTKQGF